MNNGKLVFPGDTGEDRGEVQESEEDIQLRDRPLSSPQRGYPLAPLSNPGQRPTHLSDLYSLGEQRVLHPNSGTQEQLIQLIIMD